MLMFSHIGNNNVVVAKTYLYFVKILRQFLDLRALRGAGVSVLYNFLVEGR